MYECTEVSDWPGGADREIGRWASVRKGSGNLFRKPVIFRVVLVNRLNDFKYAKDYTLKIGYFLCTRISKYNF